MKKFIGLLLMGLFVISLPIVACAQAFDPIQSGAIADYFTSLAALSGAVLIVTQFALKFIHTKFDQYFSWLVAVLLSGAGWFLQLGILSGLDWYWILIYGAASGLTANGLFDIGLVNMILNYLSPKAKSIKK